MLQNARFEEAAQVVLEETQCRRSIEADLPLMREIAKYNEIDCKVMMEIIRYLRTNH